MLVTSEVLIYFYFKVIGQFEKIGYIILFIFQYHKTTLIIHNTLICYRDDSLLPVILCMI